MPATSLRLKDLLTPCTPEEFFQDTWERTPLAIARGNEGHYAGLLSLRDFDQVIAFSRPRFNDPAAFQTTSPVRPTYVRGALDHASMSAADEPGIAELRQAFDQGKSLVIMAMQRRWPAIAELCRNLEGVFRCPVHANMYLTPPGSQGFAAHYDPHEVFILQLEGSKDWRLYGASEELPLVSDGTGVPRQPLGPSREVRLSPGDLLYIPRGHVHEAFTVDSLSLHLTVGINVYRWSDLLRHALAAASREDVRFRESLPEGALPANKGQLRQHFQDLLDRLVENAAGNDLFDKALESLGNQFFHQLPMLPGSRFAPPADLDQFTLETVLENRAYPLCRVVDDDSGVAIEFPGNRVGGPQRIAPALRFVAGVRRFVVRALPDDLNPQAKLVLARRLVREGLLTVVEEPAQIVNRTSDNAVSLPEDASTAPTVVWETLEPAR
ncbi:MAG: cupin domain-containing protein, partial [Deltaproteobacteria bacterium]